DGDSVRELVAEECARRFREEDLAAVAGRRDARRADHVEPEVALFADVRLASVQSHPYAHLAPVRPLVLVQGALRVDRSGDCVARPRKREEERVALRVDLPALSGAERLAHDPPVIARHALVALVSELLEQSRRALDVCEDERYGPAGQL